MSTCSSSGRIRRHAGGGGYVASGFQSVALGTARNVKTLCHEVGIVFKGNVPPGSNAGCFGSNRFRMLSPGSIDPGVVCLNLLGVSLSVLKVTRHAHTLTDLMRPVFGNLDKATHLCIRCGMWY